MKGFRNNREYSRVETLLPLDVRLVPPNAQGTIRTRISGEDFLIEFRALPDTEDQLLSEWLTTLNKKLDTIIRMMTLQQEGFHILPLMPTVISGNGMRFTSSNAFHPGDVLEMKMMLPMYQPVALYIYGQVLNSKAACACDAFHTSVKFMAIDDVVRDKIIRFVFEKEREIIREKRS